MNVWGEHGAVIQHVLGTNIVEQIRGLVIVDVKDEVGLPASAVVVCTVQSRPARRGADWRRFRTL